MPLVDEETDQIVAWANVGEVKLYTGIVVSDEEIMPAQFIIELFAGTTADATVNISSRNLRMLTMAVAYQTPWMAEHPDVFTSMDTESNSSNGASFTPAHANAHLLAPLAKRCLDRVSWANMPLKIRGAGASYNDTRVSRDSAVADDDMPWVPL